MYHIEKELHKKKAPVGALTEVLKYGDAPNLNAPFSASEITP